MIHRYGSLPVGQVTLRIVHLVFMLVEIFVYVNIMSSLDVNLTLVPSIEHYGNRTTNYVLSRNRPHRSRSMP